MLNRPFLVRFAKPCMAPNRVPQNPEYLYDENVDMMRWLGSPERLLVIDAYLLSDGPQDPPVTKKCDIEKGEDQKDRLMWRQH